MRILLQQLGSFSCSVILLRAWSAAFLKGCKFPLDPDAPDSLIVTSASFLISSDWVACISRGNKWLMAQDTNCLLGNWIITERIYPSLLKIYSLIRANFHVLRSTLSSFTNMISTTFGCLEICNQDSLCEVVNSLLMPSNNLVSTLPRIGLIVFDVT